MNATITKKIEEKRAIFFASATVTAIPNETTASSFVQTDNSPTAD